MYYHKASTYTVESVTSGHPDKVCDQISDAFVDAYLAKDPRSRVAVESFGSHGLLVIGGEVTSKGAVDAKKLALTVYRDIGYADSPKIMSNIVSQSPDIAKGVDTGGAGDQGIMYGYAINQTPQLLPKTLVLVHALTAGLERLRRHDGECAWLGPDGKAQITVQRRKITSVLVSCQHSPKISQPEIKKILIRKLIKPTIGDLAGIEVLVNPTGKFTIGGFTADTGLTGRKIMVDSYGGIIPHGGGAWSGKDPTKVDRSGAYMARFVAKNIVANGLAKECLVSVAYAIGRVKPLMVHAHDETGKDLTPFVNRHFDFSPQAMIERLNLRRPIYQPTAAYGHFSNASFPWEEVIKL